MGTDKTHMATALVATALVAAACRQGIQARFFTTSALVMMLRRAKDEDLLDKKLASLAKNQLIAIDELGYLPIEGRVHRRRTDPRIGTLPPGAP